MKTISGSLFEVNVFGREMKTINGNLFEMTLTSQERVKIL